jgi:hypothetical protein
VHQPENIAEDFNIARVLLELDQFHVKYGKGLGSFSQKFS